jgi:hypothetical protein
VTSYRLATTGAKPTARSGPKDHLEAGQQLQDQLDALREQALVVYAATRHLTLTGGVGHDEPWPEAAVKIIHDHEARKEPSPQPASAR